MHKSSTATLKIQDLSSGEQILLGLARCLFYMGKDSINLLPPKVLLLDEIDAPLHPAMTQQLIRVLTEVIAKRHNVNVILTTHSPTTVAISPEESIYQMNAQAPRIKKTSKEAALVELTADLPTLSIQYENRRQIFVESKYDAKIYDLVFRKIRPHLDPDISLHFIASGTGGDGSCGQVKQLVNSLRKAGNDSVLGIVDWDTENRGNTHISSFGLDKRYAIENYVLDPLLIAALLIRERLVSKSDLGLNENQNHIDIAAMSQAELQAIIDWVVNKMESHNPSDSNGDITQCKYLNEVSLNIPSWYLLMQGHKLEDALKETFPQLKKHNKNDGSLKLEIIQKVVDDVPKLLSVDFINLFNSLQKM